MKCKCEYEHPKGVLATWPLQGATSLLTKDLCGLDIHVLEVPGVSNFVGASAGWRGLQL